MRDELSLYFSIGGWNGLWKWSSAVDRTVTDRHSKFLLFWRHLYFMINRYNTLKSLIRICKHSNLLEQFVLVIRLPCWGLLPSNLSPSHMKEYLKGQALLWDAQNELCSMYLDVSGWLLVVFGNHAGFILPEHKKFLPPAADPCQL